MGNINSVKEKLYSYIERGDKIKIKKLLDIYPEIINQPMTADCKTLPLSRAAWRGDEELCELLIDLGADLNQQSKQGKTALIWAVIRDRFPIVTYLIAMGAQHLIKDNQNYDAMDYAILTGNYKIASYLNEKLDAPYRDSFFYFQQKQNYQYVNFDIFINGLDNRFTIQNVADFLKNPQPENPVIDPRETWGNFFTRIKEFEDPPLCERSELPSELQPQNSYKGMIRSYINGNTPYPKKIVPVNNQEDNLETIQFNRRLNKNKNPIEIKDINFQENLKEELKSDENLIQKQQGQQLCENL